MSPEVRFKVVHFNSNSNPPVFLDVEFHMHSKVATRSLAESTERAKPLKAAIKKRDVKADSKKQRKSGGVGFQC